MALPVLSNKRKNMAQNNYAIGNYATSNMANTSYLQYRWKVEANKLRYSHVPKPPYIYKPSELTQELNRRKEYMFDYDNPNQVNSVADVIMRTSVNLGESIRGVQPWMQTLQDTVSDTWALLYKGIVQPMTARDAEGKWKPDGAVLLNNQLINFSETVDIIDNVWKGFTIGSKGFKDMQGGLEGMKEVVFDRKNFDYDTGNKVIDLVLELATPTNLLSLGLGAAAKGIAKEAIEETGEQLTKKISKSFAQNYMGDIQKAFLNMPMNLTGAEQIALKNIAEHATNIKLLAGVNKFKKAVDVVDAIGPKLAIKSTVGIPWKVIKTASNSSSYVVRYLANAVDNIQPGNQKTLISTLAARPEYEFVINNVAEGAKLAGENVPVMAFDTILSPIANEEASTLRRLVRDYKKILDGKTLFNQYREHAYKTTGVVPALEEAQKAIKNLAYDDFVKSLDEFAEASSAGLYKTFDEYASVVTNLYHVTDIGEKVKGLYEIVESIKIEKQVHDLNKVHTVVMDTVNKVIENVPPLQQAQSWLDMARQQEYTALKDRLDTAKARYNGIEFNKLKQQREQLRKLYEDTKDVAYANQFNALQPRVIEYNTMLKTIKDLEEQVTNFDFNTKPSVTLMDLEFSIADSVETIETTIKVLEEQLTNPKSGFHETVLINYINTLENAITTMREGISTTQRYLGSSLSIAEQQAPYIKALTKIADDLNRLPKELLAVHNINQGINKLYNMYYTGKDGQKFADQIIEKTFKDLHGSSVTVFEAKIQNTFFDNGLIKDAEYTKFLDDIESIIDAFDNSVIESLSIGQSSTGMAADLYDNLNIALDVLRENINTLKNIYAETKNIDTLLIENIYEDVVNLKNIVVRNLKSLDRFDSFDTSVSLSLGSKSGAVRDYTAISNLKEILASIEAIEDTLELTADVLVEYSTSAVTEYTPKINAMYRNFMLLRNEDLNEMLTEVANGTYARIPVLETIDALSRYDITGLNSMRTNIISGDMNLFQENFFDMFKQTFNSTGLTTQEVKDTIEMIMDVKSSAETIIDTLEGMVSVRSLYDSVLNAVDQGLDKNVASRFMDAIQIMYDRPSTLIDLKTLHKNPNALRGALAEIMSNVENQLRPASLKHSAKLSDWRDRLFDLHKAGQLPNEALDEFYDLFGDPTVSNMSHTAIADAYSEALVHKYILNDNTDVTAKYVYMDIEGSGLNPITSSIYQQSIVIPETNTFKWYINTDVDVKHNPSSDDLYHLLFGDEKHLIPIADLKESYEKIYRAGQDANRDEVISELQKYFKFNPERIDVIFTNGEADLLQQAKTFVDSQRPPNGKIIYRLHNGLEYDVPLMNNRARYHGISDYLMSPKNVEDTKVILEDRLGIRRLTLDERKTLEQIVLDYIYKRQGEISSIGLKRGLHGAAEETQGLGKFLPTMDKDFEMAYQTLINIFNPVESTKVSNATKNLLSDIGITNFFAELSDAMESVHDTLKNLSEVDKKLQQLRVTVNPEDITSGHRLLPKDWSKNIPKEIMANNVGLDIMNINTVDGIYIPVIGVKKHTDSNLVLNFFDVQGQYITDNMLKKMTKLSGNIQRTIMYLRNPELIDSLNIHGLHQVQDTILDQLRRLAGTNYYSPVLASIKHGDDVTSSFATVYELYKIYKDVIVSTSEFGIKEIEVNGVPRFVYAGLESLYEEHADIMDLLYNPRNLFKDVLNEYGDDAKFFTMETDEMIEYYNKLAKASITNLEELDKLQNSLEFTRLKRATPIYRYMSDSFETFKSVAETIVLEVDDLVSKGMLKPEDKVSQQSIYSKLRVIAEGFDAVVSFNKLERVLNYNPEDMATYLRHHAKGLIVFNNSSLFSETYFPMRGTNKASDVIKHNLDKVYSELIANRKAYEDLGMSFEINRDFTAIYIKEADIGKFVDIPYRPLTEDFNMEEWITELVNGGLADGDTVAQYIRDFAYEDVIKAMQDMNLARRNLVGLATDASTSTLEILDDIAMEKLLLEFGELMPDKLSIDTMRHLNFFDGNYFNHSVLGHIDGRRKYMAYSAFNPAKTMYHATELLESKLGVQVQFIKLMQTPEFMVENLTDMTDDAIVDYLKKAPHLKVAFLNDKTKKGVPDFRLASININSVKDVEFAKKMHAVIVDRETYNTAYSVINNYRISNPVLRFLDRALVAPFKIGWLGFNLGVVFRNIFDTAVKNMMSTKDIGITLTMAEMTKHYYNYRNTLTEIYKHAQKQRIRPEVAVEEFFATGKARVPREIFDMITEYQKAGGGMGLVREAQEYYGDAINKMYRRVGELNSGLTEKEFRKFMQMPDDIAETWLKNKFANDTPRINNLMDTKGDLLVYKRAYEMHNKYKGKDITVENFITYLKTGRVLPEHADAYKEMLEATKHVNLEEDMLTKMMNSPVVSNALSLNMQSEEILRLSMFKYMKDKGFSTPEIMAEITKTHFDYNHKTMSQIYLEMAMPFSTFRTMSLIYWVEQFGKSPQAVEIFSDAWSAASQFKEREQEDVLLRQSLRYQMYTGNIILNEETGTTLKLNPSAVDMMNFFADPAGYITSNFHSAGRAVYDLFTMEQNSWESEEDFLERKKTYAWNLMPLIGSHVNRIRASETEDGSYDKPWILTLLLAPIFNTTWTPAQRTPYTPWTPYTPTPSRYYTRRYTPRSPKFRSYRRYLYPGKKMYPRKYYPKYGQRIWSPYSTFNRTYFGAYMKFRRGSAYPTKNYRSLNTAFSDIWRLSMTKKGSPKYRFLSFPTNKWTLKIKTQILRNLTSYNRWQ